MIENQRHLFDIPDEVAYLNCAYMSPLMTQVTEAGARGVRFKQRPWTYGAQDFFSYTEDYRALAARLIGTRADNIAIVPAVSYGLQIAANALPLSAEGEILVLEDQFPSNIYPWREKAKAAGGYVSTVPRPEDGDWTTAVLQMIGRETEILALPATHWADGGLLDLETIGMAARAAGAKLVLDLTQSLGALPFDVETIRPDFMVAAGYKWLLGPYSLGILYIAPQWQEAQPLEHNWMNRAGSEDFAGLVNYRDSFQTGARRFDMGEKSNPAQLMAASAALTQILDWGVENISYTLGARNKAMAARARALGLSVVADDLRAPHYVALGFPDGIPDGLLAALAQKHIHVSQRGNSLRVTAHLYNTDKDIERLFEALGSHE
ncbi:MAG TPA: aminotransferase class V-fold PLP-dependent enzyme [Hellea balneolensis]|uniref:Aminotransferase class V-fold PLP-dependent enzyme n=1 Tax=Hellea balneolensis TaxID=287478 RepID=A0A7V5NXR4_9PROT|nr:aminotransferase class V-fold PLP-dependent enzyme [Hellea balneolensis]